jgi:S-adenosylmethionine hydrolase
MGFEWISFTTDYGLEDGFVAACHGVAARLAPTVRIIDVTHLVPPGDIRRGATVLSQTVTDLPRAVHVAVVDPGVGTARRPVGVLTATRSVLVGPDNGLLLPAADELGGITAAVTLSNAGWHAGHVTPTFHGRDLFMPVAARLARGADLAEAGPALDPASLVRLDPPEVRRVGDRLVSAVLSVDRFGNVQLAARPDAHITRPDDPAAPVLLVNGQPARRVGTFGDVPVGELAVLVDSAGHLAVVVNGGSAADRLGVTAGETVELTPG